MAVPKIAINGFGRIGRIVTRLAKMRRHFDVVAINDLSDPAHLAYVFKYDSVHGIYPGDVRLEGDMMVIDQDPFQVLREKDPAKLPWRALGVDYVIESTGPICATRGARPSPRSGGETRHRHGAHEG